MLLISIYQAAASYLAGVGQAIVALGAKLLGA